MDPTRSGGRLLETLLDAGLIEVIGREGGEWTIFMNDPTQARDTFRRIDPDPQAELFVESASTPLPTPGNCISLLEDESIPFPGVNATSNADPLAYPAIGIAGIHAKAIVLCVFRINRASAKEATGRPEPDRPGNGQGRKGVSEGAVMTRPREKM